MMEEAPIFIVGANRSGTTLLRLMLNAHSRIAIPDELAYFRSSYAGVSIEQWRSPSFSRNTYERIVRDFVNRSVRVCPLLDAYSLTDSITRHSATNLRHPYSTVLNTWAAHHGKHRWGEKTPGNLFYIDIIQEMYPSAYFVYMVRDPRAGVASMLKTNFFPDDVVFNALSRRKHDRVAQQLLNKHVDDDHKITVRYEDLTANPEQTLRKICDCVGEAYEPAMLSYYTNSSRFMKPTASSTFNAKATEPVTTERVSAWRDILSPRDTALIESICTAEFVRYGYLRETPPLTLEARLERILKTAYWTLQSYRNRHVRHYTVKHPIFAGLRTRLSRLTGPKIRDVTG
jgi:hypothetical protein